MKDARSFHFVAVFFLLLLISTNTGLAAAFTPLTINGDISAFQLNDVARKLAGKTISCDREGEVVSLPEATNGTFRSRCFRCVCHGGNLVCSRRSCPPIAAGCPLTVPSAADECCAECAFCVDEWNQRRGQGETWPARNQRCSRMTCESGITTQSRMECVEGCAADVGISSTTHCCRLCPVPAALDEKSGKKAKVGVKSMTPSDPCVRCEVVAGFWQQCYRLACPLLNCPLAEQIRSPWSCCPQCSRQRRQLEPFSDFKSISTDSVFCDFNGRILGAGERFRPDVCTQCACGKDGRLVCRRFVCPRTCDGAVYRPQVCCPFCGELREFQQRARISTPFGGFSPLTHDFEFASNDHSLVHPTLMPGRQCVIQLNSAQIVWKENDRWSPDACTTCDCRSGQVVCQSRACPPLRCDSDGQEEKIPSGKCCPICVEVKRPSTTTLNPPSPSLFAQCKLATSGGGQLRTFDGRSIQLEPKCGRFVLTQQCSFDREHPSFNLELHNDQEGGVRKLSVELNENNGIRLGVLNFVRGKELKYRGRRIKLPLTTRIFRAFRSAAANRTTLDLHLVGLKIVWTAGRSVRVFVERKRHFGNLCGLCGNFNDQPVDDLLPQFATNVTNDEREFVDSWRVDQDDQCQPSKEVVGEEEAEQGDASESPAEVHPTEQNATNTCSRLLSPSNRAERRGFATECLKLKRNLLLQSCHSVLGLHSFLRRCAAAVCRCEHERQAEGRPTEAEEMRRRRRRKYVKKRRSPIDSIVIKMKGGRVQKTLRYTTETADEKPPEEPCFCPAMGDYLRECAQRGLLTFGLSNPNDEKTGLVAGRLRFHPDCPPVKLERL